MTDISDYHSEVSSQFHGYRGISLQIKYSAFLGVKNVKRLSRIFGANMMEIKMAEINDPLN